MKKAPTKESETARKAWVTRKENQKKLAKKLADAGRKSWVTRRENIKKANKKKAKVGIFKRFFMWFFN